MLGHLPSSFCRIPGSFPNLRGEVLSLRTTTVTAAAGLLRHTPRWSPAGPSRTWPARPSCFPAQLGKGRQVPLWSLQSPACPGPAWPPSLTSLPPPPPCSAPAVCLLLVPTLPPGPGAHFSTTASWDPLPPVPPTAAVSVPIQRQRHCLGDAHPDHPMTSLATTLHFLV